VDEACFLAIIC